MKSFRHYLIGLTRILGSLVRLGTIERCRLSVEAQMHREALLASPKYSDLRCLARSEHKVFSQHGEDGILLEIFRRIGEGGRKFAEIGVAPLENNTLLLWTLGWRGVWVDGSLTEETLPTRLKEACREGSLKTVSKIITRENVSKVLRDAGVASDIDFLSLDIDMNTYALWEGMADFRPRVVMVEYNAHYPSQVDWRVDCSADALWDGSTYFGASLKAFARLGEERGYRLVGCDLSGTNAFFVRSDLMGEKFVAPGNVDHHFEPPRYHLYTMAPGHRPSTGTFVVESQSIESV